MLRHERRMLVDCLLIGAALTALVIGCDAAGLLRPLEDVLYDVRCRLCQHFTPPPSDKLVHLDIDDAALETIGRWPWPRATLARVLDEVRLAGPKVVEMDTLLSEPQRVDYEPVGDVPAEPAPSTTPSSAPSTLPALASLAAVVPAAAPATSPATSAPSTQPAVSFRRIDNDAEL